MIGPFKSLLLMAAAMPAAVQAQTCDRSCLNSYIDRYLAALVAKDASQLPLAHDVRATENLVPLQIGKEGLWRTISGKGQFDIYAPDVTTSNANWIGIVDEMGKPLFMALRLKIENGQITEAESLLGRSPLTGADKAPLPRAEFSQVEPKATRSSRERLMKIVDQHWTGMESGQPVKANYRPDCIRYDNGHLTTGTALSPAEGGPHTTNIGELGCYGQLASGRFHNGNVVEPRRFWGVDEERGLVIGYFSPNVPGDREAVQVFGEELKVGPDEKVPFTIEQVELFKVVNGQIKGVEVVLGPRVPYRMRSPFDMTDLWTRTK